MARAGTFGRAPRGAPSITNTLVAIAREMQRQRDENIMTAWKGGGVFEGEQATDEMVLAHWRKRLEGVSPDDPLYDTYRTAVLQLEYAIAESKQTVKYAQGKISEAAMAKFYTDWAKKVPQNSEFYRVLQRDAAQYLRAARSRGAADAKRRAEEAYRAKQASMEKREEAARFVTDTFRLMAQRGNAQLDIEQLIGGYGGGGNDLLDFTAEDPEVMMRFVEAVNQNDGKTVIYHNPVTQEPITGAAILEEMKRLDPGFDGTLDVASVRLVFDRQITSLTERIAYANKTGHTSDANNLSKEREYFINQDRLINAWPVTKTYMQMNEAMNEAVGDPTLSPAARLAIYDKYLASIAGLAEDPTIAADDFTRSALMSEVNGNEKGVSLRESFNRSVNPTGEPGMIAQDRAQIQILQDQVDLFATSTPENPVVWTQGIYDRQSGLFVPQAGGNSIGAARREEVEGLQYGNLQTVYVPQAGGRPVALTVSTVPVMLAGRDPVTNEPVAGSQKPALEMVSVSFGGRTVDFYGYTAADGNKVWSEQTPWDETKTTFYRGGQNGPVLDVSEYLKTINYDRTSGIDQDNVIPGVSIRGGRPMTAQGQPAVPGEIVLGGWDVIVGTNPAIGATREPMTEFSSLSAAVLNGIPEGDQMYESLRRDPAFIRTLQNDAYRSAGVEVNALTGEPIGQPTQEQWRRIGRNLSSMQTMLELPNTSGVNNYTGFVLRDRDPLPADPVAPWRLKGSTTLPSDAVRDDPQFGAIANALVPQTNNLRQGVDPKTGQSITLGANPIKVPGINITGSQPLGNIGINNIVNPAAPIPSYVPPTYTPPPLPSYTYPNQQVQPGYGDEQTYAGGRAL